MIYLAIFCQQRALSLVTLTSRESLKKISEWATLRKVTPLPANVDRRPPLQQGLMNFQLQSQCLSNTEIL